ncbi:MAG: hypothetical protein ACYDDI_12335 [Candidatus Acidiferrales bacterium]
MRKRESAGRKRLSFAGARSPNRRMAQKYRNDILLEPWFLPKKITDAMRGLLPLHYWMRMRYYFDDYGCLLCGRKKVLYAANGMCEDCRARVGRRVLISMRRRNLEPPARARVPRVPKVRLQDFRRTKARDLLVGYAHLNRNFGAAFKADVAKSWRLEKIQMPFGVVEIIS